MRHLTSPRGSLVSPVLCVLHGTGSNLVSLWSFYMIIWLFWPFADLASIPWRCQSITLVWPKLVYLCLQGTSLTRPKEVHHGWVTARVLQTVTQVVTAALLPPPILLILNQVRPQNLVLRTTSKCPSKTTVIFVISLTHLHVYNTMHSSSKNLETLHQTCWLILSSECH